MNSGYKEDIDELSEQKDRGMSPSKPFHLNMPSSPSLTFPSPGRQAFWNSPNDVKDHARAACACALRQQALLARLRTQWAAEGLPQLRARMGLSTGTVLHGNIGSRCRMEWGLIGDEVSRVRVEGSRCSRRRGQNQTNPIQVPGHHSLLISRSTLTREGRDCPAWPSSHWLELA